jgi:exosortase
MSARRRWNFTDGLFLSVLVALAIAAAWHVWTSIFVVGLEDEEQSHVLIAPLVVVWLAWLRRDRFRFVGPRWSPLGPVVIAAGVGTMLIGERALWEAFEQLGAVLLLVGAVLTIIGPRLAANLYPSFGAMVFLLHVPGRFRQDIAIPLQNYSAQITEWMLGMLQFPIAREGNQLIINGVPVGIAEACNGMRMVTALALVSYAFVFSVPMRNWVRVLILGASPVVALVVNVVRLAPTTLMYGYSEHDTAELFHDISGWAALLVALAGLWVFLAMLRWLEIPIAPIKVARA